MNRALLVRDDVVGAISADVVAHSQGAAEAAPGDSPAESWAGLLRDCQRRGMRAPVLAMGEGALGVLGGVAGRVPGS